MNFKEYVKEDKSQIKPKPPVVKKKYPYAIWVTDRWMDQYIYVKDEVNRYRMAYSKRPNNPWNDEIKYRNFSKSYETIHHYSPNDDREIKDLVTKLDFEKEWMLENL